MLLITLIFFCCNFSIFSPYNSELKQCWQYNDLNFSMLHKAIRRTRRLHIWRKTYYIDGKTQMRVAWARIIGTPVYTLPSIRPLYEEDRQYSGSGISLILGSGFGILKQKRGEIRYWKFAREVGWQKQPSGLRDWTKFWVRITGLKNSTGDPLWKYLQ